MVTASSNPEPEIQEHRVEPVADVSRLHELQPDVLGWELLLRRAAASLAFGDPLAGASTPMFDPLLVSNISSPGVLAEFQNTGSDHEEAIGFVDGASVLDLSSHHVSPDAFFVHEDANEEENFETQDNEDLLGEEQVLEGSEVEIQP